MLIILLLLLLLLLFSWGDDGVLVTFCCWAWSWWWCVSASELCKRNLQKPDGNNWKWFWNFCVPPLLSWIPRMQKGKHPELLSCFFLSQEPFHSRVNFPSLASSPTHKSEKTKQKRRKNQKGKKKSHKNNLIKKRKKEKEHLYPPDFIIFKIACPPVLSVFLLLFCL